MANIAARPTNFPRRINSYVPAMQYSADVNWNGTTRINFGAPIAPSNNNVLPLTSINVAGSADISAIFSFLPYGRNLQVVANGASTAVITITGWDYLGQPMTENITLNGTTPVLGKKAFFNGNRVSWPAAAGVSISVGGGDSVGLPYRALRVVMETVNGLLVASGTLTAAGLAPQTATSADPRGVYISTGVHNGVNVITAAFDMVNDVDSSNNGGLHGVRHFT